MKARPVGACCAALGKKHYYFHKFWGFVYLLSPFFFPYIPNDIKGHDGFSNCIGYWLPEDEEVYYFSIVNSKL